MLGGTQNLWVPNTVSLHATCVQDLLADLCSFCNGDSLPAVAQAALAHAQFETIHPFASTWTPS
jgi:Fic family protein